MFAQLVQGAEPTLLVNGALALICVGVYAESTRTNKKNNATTAKGLSTLTEKVDKALVNLTERVVEAEKDIIRLNCRNTCRRSRAQKAGE